ncbi:hypothetical protein PM082_007096 [Marasmius tenuissimus]|nr:hypothetical protein PM082_007096 [Marasmius tenuissimus]
MTAPPNFVPTSSPLTSRRTSTGAIAGSVVGAIVFLFGLVPALIFLSLRLRKHNVRIFKRGADELPELVITPLPYQSTPPAISRSTTYKTRPADQDQRRMQLPNSISVITELPAHVQAQLANMMRRLETLEAEGERSAPPDYVSRAY